MYANYSHLISIKIILMLISKMLLWHTEVWVWDILKMRIMDIPSTHTCNSSAIIGSRQILCFFLWRDVQQMLTRVARHRALASRPATQRACGQLNPETAIGVKSVTCSEYFSDICRSSPDSSVTYVRCKPVRAVTNAVLLERYYYNSA